MARKKNTESVVFKGNAEIAKAELACEKAYDALCRSRQQIAEDLKALFIKNGGCEGCGGRGWVVAWDTLDSLSGCYAEYAGCSNPDCTPETRKKSGLDHSYYTKYDQNRGVSRDLPENFQKVQAAAEKAYEDVRIARDSVVRAWSPSKGKLVEVIAESPRSNVTPVGIKGRIFWSGTNNYGTEKFGLKDETGETWWVNAKQIIVIDPEVSQPDSTEVVGTFQYEARSGKASQLTVKVGKKTLTEWCPNSAWQRSETDSTKLIIANWWLEQKGLLKGKK